MKNILIIEDDRKISKALMIRLKTLGCSVRSAEDAAMGYQAVVKQTPDLVLLDIGLPAGGGFTVADRILTADDLPMIPIIFMTASKDPELRQKVGEYNPVAFFEKPYDIELLMRTIQEVLGEATPASTG